MQCGEKNENFRAIPEPPASYPCSPADFFLLPSTSPQLLLPFLYG